MISEALQMLGTRSPNMVEQYMVVYAKILNKEPDGIALHDVYFGGIADSMSSAEIIARDCVNTAKGGIIIPKIMQITEENQIIDLMMEVSRKFLTVTQSMIESDRTIKKRRP